MPSSTFLAGVAVFVVLLVLDQRRRRAAMRRRAERGEKPRGGGSEDWLATRLVLETDPETAGEIVAKVARAAVSKPLAAGRWALVTGFDRYDASAGVVRTDSGSVTLAPLSAPDDGGTPDGAAWLDFRDRVAKAARKAGIETRTEPSPPFVATAGPGGTSRWVPRA
ncbi:MULTISPECIES: hypothetical protein [Mumia]|uniref:hypothetical protein n=1 Tax=Mumia TaxID=1546255 RepID=UPI001422F05A|nr:MULTISPECIES: hypothetical protein [unclassified Mumia]QMW66148.1 hypothetical protein H4N58_18735 [Mumia sp. ZJ1417]